MGGSIPKPQGKEQVALGAAFKEARNAASKTLAATAEALGVSINTVRWHEAGASMMAPDKVLAAGVLFNADPVAIGAAYRAQRELDALSAAAANETLTVVFDGHTIGLTA